MSKHKSKKNENLFCKDCDSDPFTQNQKCLNFDKTLEWFHVDQGHTVVHIIQESHQSQNCSLRK